LARYRVINTIFFDDSPESAKVRIVWNAFEKNAGVAIAQRAVNDITVTGDPADVGGAP